MAPEHDRPPLDREPFGQGALDCDLRYQRPGEPTGFPDETGLPPMRKSDDPDYKLDWDAWIAHEAEGNQKYRKLTDDSFEYSAPDSPWLVRWENYWAESAAH